MTDRHIQTRIDAAALLSTAIGVFGMLQFVVCVKFAAKTRGDFEFGREFLSRLGETSNSAAPLFNGSMILLGICLSGFFVVGFLVRAGGSVCVRIFSCSGTLASFGLIGIGATPLDLFYVLHHVFLVLWLIPMVIMVGSSFFLYDTDGFVRKLMLIVSAILGTSAAIYIMNGTGPGAPAFQALVTSTAVVWLLLTAVHLSRMAVYQVAGLRLGRDQETRRYIRQLEQSGLYKSDGRSSGRWEP